MASQTLLELLELNPSHKGANELNKKLKIAQKINVASVTYELNVFNKIFSERHLLNVTLSKKTKYGMIIGRAR